MHNCSNFHAIIDYIWKSVMNNNYIHNPKHNISYPAPACIKKGIHVTGWLLTRAHENGRLD